MINYFKSALLFLMTGLVISCSQVLQTVDLDINAEDNSLQEEFDVTEKTLTIKIARAQSNAPYLRQVLQSGRSQDAQPISEKVALISNLPENRVAFKYKIGIGDTLNFSRLIENNRSSNAIASNWPKVINASDYKLGIGDTLTLTLIKQVISNNQMAPNGSDATQNLVIIPQQSDETINSTGRIGSDGSILLLEVGRIDANGKSLNELRSEVRNILIRNGVSPRFQLEISEFKSKKAYLTVNSTSKVIVLNDRTITIKDILTSANIGLKPGVITRIRLQRSNQKYIMFLRDIYSAGAPEIDIRSGDHIFVEDTSANIVMTTSTVDNEGYLVFEGIGKVKAAGYSINELRSKINDLSLKLPDSQNAFQLQIKEFKSQTALVSIPGKAGVVVPITSKPTSLAEVLTQNGLSVDGNNVSRITLYRNEKSFVFTLDDLINPKTPLVYLQSGDRVTTEVLPYKENKVFILGGVSPQIFKINPANRETLADVLFTNGGALSASGAKRSEVYLLRGTDPVVAYHLDAQSPTRLIVADAMQLRPNDIVYVAEQPIISFNRALATILPLRILLRDIQEENIP